MGIENNCCSCRRIGGSNESVMGKKSEWEIIFGFTEHLDIKIFLAWDIEGAINEWRNKYSAYNISMIKSCKIKNNK
jgi:hypothetical protein